ncbi:hypothetical protein Desca_1464 [Desulfotomaculum nigrificans CO-1-SRB]|uniref:Uncharacterized protein n=1 Tax=Desulfotomaculum nigrificans (strain DSM 14880 / VKM B-2319 / CO-1-SRB) TaxID=868595 RepID=F6B600_DESCC|nr:hypothetical protein [Desulfotomaculum nigrificans]AEF94319.1 hypothetical protein Desca_1464 [Desulfotomaculum nigrificans CO-1-SRB]
MKDTTWRYPNFGFWAVHAVSLAALGYLAFKVAENRCHAGHENNMSFPERMPQNKEPGF